MKLNFPSIPERITYLLDGRKAYPWALSIGISKGSMESVMKLGGMLGGDALSAIGRCENARIDWILDGRGAPYSVACATSDDGAAELLQDLLEEHWNITIVADGQHIALVLDQPGSFDVKDGKDDNGVQQYRTIEYPIIEVIVGHIGRHTMELVRSRIGQGVSLKLVTADVMTQIERGRMGTWRLLQAPEAVLLDAEQIGSRHRIFTQFNQQELFPASKEEAILLDHYRAMTPENRSAINQVTTAMAEYREAADLKGKAS
ncbi:hypothetical protein [Herminiimonas sp. CN]|uniref:hypothetical protein n=1 Tax=Herminiimonas sp. CN TaxID=1349818 RepID=UPI0004740834|nr:hypothetical protein [Herminiimonas sp. CN]